MNPLFQLPTKVIMGGGCVISQSGAMKPLGKRAIIVTGRRSAAACGALDDVLSALKTNGQSSVLFDRVMSNPTVDCVYEGAGIARAESADFVIGIGGGSPMDSAKAIAVLAAQDIPREMLFSGQYATKTLPCVMIPTTAGTGSEVTQYAILTNDEQRTKTTMAAPFMFPAATYLDSKYLSALPHRVMVNTVVDALSHCVEGYLSCRANPLTDVFARGGMRAISSCFSRLRDDTLTENDLSRLLYASTMGGMVIAHTGTTAVHAMGYSLTYFKHIDHGRANGLLLGEFIKFVELHAPERVAEALAAMMIYDSGVFAEILAGLLGRPEDMSAEEAKLYTSIAIKAKNIPNCVAVPTEEEILRLYRTSFGITGGT